MKKKRALAQSRWWHFEESIMRPKLQKTDRRFTGHHVYEFFIDFAMTWNSMMATNTFSGSARASLERSQLNEIRNWCWTTFGPGCELETALLLHFREQQEPNWCWLSEHNKLRIYFKKETADWYALKWT